MTFWALKISQSIVESIIKKKNLKESIDQGSNQETHCNFGEVEVIHSSGGIICQQHNN